MRASTTAAAPPATPVAATAASGSTPGHAGLLRRLARPRHPRLAPSCHPLLLAAGVAAWLAGFGNAALWMALAKLSLLDGPRGWAFGASVALMLFFACLVPIGLLAWRHTLKPVLVLMLLAAAAATHFMLTYHVVIDASMLANVLQTDRHEARDLLGARLVATLLLLGVVPAWIVARTPLREMRWPRRLAGNCVLVTGALAAFTALVLVSYSTLSSASRNHRELRYMLNPLNTLYAAGRLAATSLAPPGRALAPLGEDARLAAAASAGADAKPPLLMLVIGETARADHFQLNGYGRPTTPELAALGVVSQRNAWSCGTSTAVSLPCMFSGLGREAFAAHGGHAENLLDVLQHAGLAVLWVDNQSGCKGVCDRVAHASTTRADDDAPCAGENCFDGAMLQGLDARIAALPADRRARGLVGVLHQMGSHGPAYHRRSPLAFKRFEPECATAALQECDPAQLVNAYDNSIAYTDHLLAESIGWLRAREADHDVAMLYVSDHGESLGERGLYLHGLPYSIAPDVQKHVPWITWLGAGFARRNGVDRACLAHRVDEPLSHDHFFHSVLGLMGVETRALDPRLDAYAACRVGEGFARRPVRDTGA